MTGDSEMDCTLGLDPSRTFGPAPKSRSGLRTFAVCVLLDLVSALVLVAIR